MRIPDGYTKRVVSPTKVKGRSSASAVAGTSGAAVTAADSVEFSSRAGDVARARLLALDAPDIREPLVSELSGQIDRGQYHVTGSEVAPAMIQDHLQFAGVAGVLL